MFYFLLVGVVQFVFLYAIFRHYHVKNAGIFSEEVVKAQKDEQAKWMNKNVVPCPECSGYGRRGNAINADFCRFCFGVGALTQVVSTSNECGHERIVSVIQTMRKNGVHLTNDNIKQLKDHVNKSDCIASKNFRGKSGRQ